MLTNGCCPQALDGRGLTPHNTIDRSAADGWSGTDGPLTRGGIGVLGAISQHRIPSRRLTDLALAFHALDQRSLLA
jgi:hypothetical protein